MNRPSYERPNLTRFGTMRQLTRVGFNQDSDGFVLGTPDGDVTGNELGIEGGPGPGEGIGSR